MSIYFPGFKKIIWSLTLEQRQQGINLTDRSWSGGKFRHDVFKPMPETDVVDLACGGKGIRDLYSPIASLLPGEKTILKIS